MSEPVTRYKVRFRSLPQTKRREYGVRAKIWMYQGKAAWYFVTLPAKTAKDIRREYAGNHRGWESLPVTVELGSSVWKTSIFRDAKADSYILPFKAAVRKAERVSKGDTVRFRLSIER